MYIAWYHVMPVIHDHTGYTIPVLAYGHVVWHNTGFPNWQPDTFFASVQAERVLPKGSHDCFRNIWRHCEVTPPSYGWMAPSWLASELLHQHIQPTLWEHLPPLRTESVSMVGMTTFPSKRPVNICAGALWQAPQHWQLSVRTVL